MGKQAEKQIHVLYIPRWYPHRYDPMPGLFIERHGISASEHCKISVLYVHQDDKTAQKGFEIIKSQNALPEIRIYYKKANTGIEALDKLINICRFYRAHQKGYKLIKKDHGKPNLIHVHVLTRNGVFAIMKKICSGIPYLITEHWTRYLPSTAEYHGWFGKKVTAMVAKRASFIMPVTENLRDAMINCGLRNPNYRVIPNVVDIEMFSPDLTVNNKVKRIVHVSCFDNQQKNISGILHVLKKLFNARKDFICDMIGDGIDYEMLTNYSKTLDIPSDRINFLGLKENQELADIMKTSDFMIMFSRYENLPVVILESYACGVPVISTDVGGIREHMDDDLGILINSGDEKALEESISKILDKKVTYNKETLRKYAIQHFSEEVIGKQLFEAYKDALGIS